MVFRWYRIPGFECYDINKDTKEVRSSKHYKKDKFHIMKVRYGKVTIVDDYGKPTTISVDDLYDMTFNGKYPIKPVGDYEYWANTMTKSCRNLEANVDILNGIYNSIEDSGNEFILDFSKIDRSEPKRYDAIETQNIKPFYCLPFNKD